MKKHNIREGLTRVMRTLYEGSSNAVMANNNTLEWFKTSVGVSQGCKLSPCLFNIFLEQIMQETLHDFEGKVKVGGRPVTNLRFMDDIDLLGINSKSDRRL